MSTYPLILSALRTSYTAFNFASASASIACASASGKRSGSYIWKSTVATHSVQLVILILTAFVSVVILVGSGVIFGKGFAQIDFREDLSNNPVS